LLHELTTNQKGLVAETAIIHEAVRLGICVSQPLDDERYDLIFDLPRGLVRVQCKWARRLGDVIVVRCYSARRTVHGLRRRVYTGEETDVIAAYCPDVSTCYLLPVNLFSGRTQIHLRLEPSLNNQAEGIHWACEFEFGATLKAFQGP
jgi:PD-(D/E)XK endonuclease